MTDILLAKFRRRWKKFFENHEREKQELESYVSQVDLPENKEFMEEACDYWEKLGNNGEPAQPEDLDVDEASFEDDGECHCYDCKESR